MHKTLFILTLSLLAGTQPLSESGCSTDADGDGVTITQGDCNDADANVSPNALEVCDGIDNNCDTMVDEGFDQDGDGYSPKGCACTLESPSTCGADCDDGSALVSPGAPELCNSIDDNCDGAIDEGFDQDSDGFTACTGDCNDAFAAIYPGALEVCNSLDDNCDGVIDEGFDQDSDLYSSCAGDCNDMSSMINPGALEACNAVDDDCDGLIDEGFDADGDGYRTCDGDCNDQDAAVHPSQAELCNLIDDDCDTQVDEGYDGDVDGYTSCGGDCNDTNASIRPNASETCNKVDDDCDGSVDEGFDGDRDGYTSCSGDCNDNSALIHPGAAELCNKIDDDCDSTIDEGFDADGDGYTSCGGDCNDSNAAIKPGAAEACNGVDDDCDGLKDEGFDVDKDGYTSCGGDCNDNNSAIRPNAIEDASVPATMSDGLDNDCDGYTDTDCDGTAFTPLPLIVLDAPARGTFTSSSSVAVSGRVLPGILKTPLTSVTRDGGTLTVTTCSKDGGVRFSGTASLTRGLNTLRIRATDSAGGADKAEVSAIYSPTFLNVRTGTISNAFVAELNQGSWNILADFLEGMLTPQMMEESLLGANPLVDTAGTADCLDWYDVYLEGTDYQHDDVEITFTITGGKIRTTARILHPKVTMAGDVYYDLSWYCGGWSDTVGLTADISFSDVYATADGIPSVNSSGEVVVNFSNVVVNASGAAVNVTADGSLYDWLFGFIEGEIEDRLTLFLETALSDFIKNDLGPMLSEEVNVLALDYSLEVLGIRYGVAFDFQSISVPEGTVDVVMKMKLTYPVDSRIPTNPGAVDHSNSYSRNITPTVTMKVGLDFFNSSLHALWEGGSLFLTGLLMEEPLLYGTAEPALPPVVVPGTSSYLMNLKLGDVVTTLEAPQPDGSVQTLTAAVAATVQMDVDPIVMGTDIRFDVNFGTVTLTFDMLEDMAIDESLQADMEAGFSEMLTLYLDELEVYLEGQTISYLDLPLSFQSISIAQDSVNTAMLSITANATYTGP